MQIVKKNVLMIVGSYFPLISGGGLQCKSIVDNLSNKVNFRIFTTLDYKGFGKNYDD